MKKRSRRKPKTPTLDLSQYRGQWVAIHPKTKAVVSHHFSCQEAEREAIAAGVMKPLLLPVPKSNAFFVGNLHHTGKRP